MHSNGWQRGDELHGDCWVVMVQSRADVWNPPAEHEHIDRLRKDKRYGPAFRYK